VDENVIFDWAKLISNEITTQLSIFNFDIRFYMSSYLIFAIIYCHTFEGLNISQRIKIKVDPVTMWCQALRKQRVRHHFHEVYSYLVSKFKKLLFGEDTSQLPLEVASFLKGRGVLEKMENYNIIKVFCSIEKPIFLPYYISEKLFVIEISQQYNFWFHILSKKRKN
jgi:hypothetical protein